MGRNCFLHNNKFMNRKIEWNVAFEKYLRELDAKKPVVWGGMSPCCIQEYKTSS